MKEKAGGHQRQDDDKYGENQTPRAAAYNPNRPFLLTGIHYAARFL